MNGAILAMLTAQVAEDPIGIFDQIGQAILQGKWQAVAALVAVAVVFGARQGAARLPGKLGIFFASARGGALLALLGGVVTALAQAIVAGGEINVTLLVNGVVLGITAAGGWTLVRRLIWGDAAPTAYPSPAPPTP